MNISCPHCATLIENDGSLAGQMAVCPACRGQFRMPVPEAAPAFDLSSLQRPPSGSAWTSTVGKQKKPSSANPTQVAVGCAAISLIFIVCCIALVGSRGGGRKSAVVPLSGITWNEVDAIYGSKSQATQLQKKEGWKCFKGKKVKWVGTVASVGETFGCLTLNVKMNPTTLFSDILIFLPEGQRNNAIELGKGDEITFTGILDDWGTILPMTLKDGAILSYAK